MLPRMNRTARRSRLLMLALTGGVLALVAAVPVLGQAAAPNARTAVTPAASDPAASAPTASEKPGKGPKADKHQKDDAEPEAPVTLSGTIGTRTDEDGGTKYTLTVGSTVYELEVGPPWFWGDANPLKASVGKSVTIEGDEEGATSSVEVRVLDGTTIREPGKPPWAGGWKVVGKAHPGWSQEKADRQAAKGAAGHGRPDWAGPKGSDDPDESEAPGG
jgi:hypothetical protein